MRAFHSVMFAHISLLLLSEVTKRFFICHLSAPFIPACHAGGVCSFAGPAISHPIFFRNPLQFQLILLCIQIEPVELALLGFVRLIVNWPQLAHLCASLSTSATISAPHRCGVVNLHATPYFSDMVCICFCRRADVIGGTVLILRYIMRPSSCAFLMR